MRTKTEIEKMIKLMRETYKKGDGLSGTMSPADAYAHSEGLQWVLGEDSNLPEHFSQNGIDYEAWLKEK